MTAITLKTELENTLGSILTKGQNHHFKVSNTLGNFECKVENHEDFASVRRNFKNNNQGIRIPFSAAQPRLVMIFTLNGQTAFRDPYDPFIQTTCRHSLSYFNDYKCQILLDDQSKQDDITFSLAESFYKDLITENQINQGNHLFEKILNRKPMNMINNHLPMDAGISGILQNILHCPYKDELKKMFMRENIRALLFLQFFHFHSIATGKSFSVDDKITSRDREILQAIKDHLSLNFLETTSLQELSKQFGINEFKLKYGFKKLFETSPIKYIQQKRLELSLLLLQETSNTISEIADKIGYNHANNFSLAFRKAFGKSPQQYR